MDDAFDFSGETMEEDTEIDLDDDALSMISIARPNIKSAIWDEYGIIARNGVIVSKYKNRLHCRDCFSKKILKRCVHCFGYLQRLFYCRYVVVNVFQLLVINCKWKFDEPPAKYPRQNISQFKNC